MGQLFIDPSIDSMGWAYWNGKDYRTQQPPTDFGLIKSTEKKWEAKIFEQGNSLISVLNRFVREPHISIYCEMPQFFSSAKGNSAAVTGSLQKLSAMVGVVMYIAHQNSDNPLHLLPVNEWKGQLPKSVVISRILKFYGPKKCKNFKDDIWDAVGMGLYKMGVL